MEKKKETPFQIKIPKEKQKQMAKDLENVSDLKSAIHFVKNYKKYIIVNRKFKKKLIKFSITSVASISAIVFGISLIKHQTKDKSKEIDMTPVETTIESLEEKPLGPILSDESLVQMNYTEDTIPTPSIDLEDIGEEVASIYDVTPSTTISFPKASDTNEESDYTNYYKVKDKYGAYIEKLAEESGVDARLIIAMIAQENPDEIDETSVGTYGPMCVTSVHNGETYNYYHYNDDHEYVNTPVTININNLKNFSDNMEIYEGGAYGNITKADAMCIYYGVVILKENFFQINKTNNLSLEENVPLAIAGYNHGYPDVIYNTRYSSTLFDACYSIRYTHAGDSKNDDDQYNEHVFNKIPDEELDRPIIFIDNNENIISFNLERNNELATIGSEINDKKRSI